MSERRKEKLAEIEGERKKGREMLQWFIDYHISKLLPFLYF